MLISKRKIVAFYWLFQCVKFHAVLFTYGRDELVRYLGTCLCFVLTVEGC